MYDWHLILGDGDALARTNRSFNNVAKDQRDLRSKVLQFLYRKRQTVAPRKVCNTRYNQYTVYQLGLPKSVIIALNFKISIFAFKN